MVIGVTGAMGLAKFAAHLMTTAKGIDPIACGAVAVLLAAIAAVSGWWATRRIANLNPIDVLRSSE